MASAAPGAPRSGSHISNSQATHAQAGPASPAKTPSRPHRASQEPTRSRKLKVAFLVDDENVDRYVYDLISHVYSGQAFGPPVIITGYAAGRKIQKSRLARVFDTARSEGALSIPNKALFSLLMRFIRKVELMGHLPSHEDAAPNRCISSIGTLRKLQVRGQWSRSNLYLRFTDDDLAAIRSESIDVIIRCGIGILEGGILESSTFGVLSFHHGDNRVNRGGPPGFWEVLESEPSSGFVIQRLNDELDGGDVLFRGNIMTQKTWTANNHMLRAKSNVFFKRILDGIAEKNELPPIEEISLHDRPLFRLEAKSRVLLQYIRKVIVPIIYKKMLRTVAPERIDRWSIAYAEFDEFKKSLWRYKEIRNPRGRFLADPFVCTRKGRSIIFVEDFCLDKGVGRISAIEIANGKEKFLGVVLEDDVHLSFPFIFEDANRLYMIPESYETREIKLYECTEFPMKWEFRRTLMTDVSAVDTMVIQSGGMWFMLTNICSANIGDHDSELHVFWANDLHSSKWRPTAQGNPVIFDSRKARNGGLIHHRGCVYRVNQVQGQVHYGQSFAVNRITELSDQRYDEVEIDRVAPLFKRGIHSTHHFHADAHYSVVDYCRTVRLGAEPD